MWTCEETALLPLHNCYHVINTVLKLALVLCEEHSGSSICRLEINLIASDRG